jgi:hypothetical protein
VTPLKPSNSALVVNIKPLLIVIIFSGHGLGVGIGFEVSHKLFCGHGINPFGLCV